MKEKAKSVNERVPLDETLEASIEKSLQFGDSQYDWLQRRGSGCDRVVARRFRDGISKLAADVRKSFGGHGA